MPSRDDKAPVRRFCKEVGGGRIVEHGGAANPFEPLLRIGGVRVVGS